MALSRFLRLRSLAKPATLIFIFRAISGLVSAHDLMATHATVRLKSDTVEVQIKIAADSAWPLIQDTVAPGAVFVLEDFATVGRPILLSYARTMEEFTVDGVAVEARTIEAAVVEDNFLFTFVYPRPPHGALNLKEKYLGRLPADYVFLGMLLGENDSPLSSAVLHGADFAATIALPPRTEKSTIAKSPR